MRYEVGQVWTRDGKKREIVNLFVENDKHERTWATNCEDDTKLRYVLWRKSPKHKEHRCWCSTWFAWVEKATLSTPKEIAPCI